jgi:hypothetical protein
MATNIWQDRIIFALQKLLQESSPWKCYYLKPRGSECLVFTPALEAQLAKTTGGTVYRYTLLIDIYTASAATADRDDLLQQVADIKRILNDNTHYQPSSINYYFDGVVDGIEYDWDDEDEGGWKARITWSGTHEEVV